MVTRSPEEQAILENILAYLKKQSREQQELCNFLGIKPQAVTNWKNGNNSSYLKYLPKIAEFFNIPLCYLTGEIVGGNKTSDILTLEQRLVEYFSQCDADGQLRIIQCAMNEYDKALKKKKGFTGKSVIG